MNYDVSDCVEALREARRRIGHSPTAREYQELDLSPSQPTIQATCGSWNEAKRMAELETTAHSHDVDCDFFDTLDTQSAYWLGFLWGDGWWNTSHDGKQRGIGLNLQRRDEQHVRRFKHDIGSDHKISYEERPENEQDQVWIRIGQTEFTDHLRAHGFTPSKTNDGSLPTTKEGNVLAGLLWRHWLRGLYDADGSFTVYKTSSVRMSIAGEPSRMNRIADRIPDRVFDDVRRRQFSEDWRDVSTILAQGSSDALADYLYPNGPDTEPTLDRKIPPVTWD